MQNYNNNIGQITETFDIPKTNPWGQIICLSISFLCLAVFPILGGYYIIITIILLIYSYTIYTTIKNIRPHTVFHLGTKGVIREIHKRKGITSSYYLFEYWPKVNCNVVENYDNIKGNRIFNGYIMKIDLGDWRFSYLLELDVDYRNGSKDRIALVWYAIYRAYTLYTTGQSQNFSDRAEIAARYPL